MLKWGKDKRRQLDDNKRKGIIKEDKQNYNNCLCLFSMQKIKDSTNANLVIFRKLVQKLETKCGK